MTDSLPLQASQIRAARALLGWSQTDLADRAGVVRPTIAMVERSKATHYDRTLSRIKDALEAAGIVFINDGKYVGATLKVA
jgi:transcriptional regulator with XRE-family HTH domain